MNALMLLWWTAIVFGAAAVGAMSGLIVGRYFRMRDEARYAAERRTVDSAVVAILTGRVAERRQLLPNPRSARAAAEALVEITALVRGADRARLLEGMRELGIDDVIRHGAEHGPQVNRLVCIEALAAFPDEETHALLQRIATSRGNLDRRMGAVRTLAEIGAGLSIEQMLDGLIRDRLPASGQVIELLHRMAKLEPAEAVAALNRRDLTPAVRPLVVEALGETGDYSLIPHLIEAANDASMEVRAAAVRALGKLAHPAAEPALAKALKDKAWAVRALAADAVGRSGLVSLLDPLSEALKDPEWWVRHRAAGGLAKLGPAGLERLAEIAEGDDIAGSTASLALAERAA